ncbi:MAG: hypothetical protein A2W91_01080 [Bacteroidetes bacterium GWF2_38_335]|nr:MAG: hypothetical protein A2W91_01080 [Bacteroidetes bacterium GWF2_38_335]OFY80347.1 MAG: hypothetical protein A2281_17590 [Bacteroidetes bacterium RIFOXYA12_FULL_38_20]HBS88851.1 hypothetical protein [Bacteroidales bacterium]
MREVIILIFSVLIFASGYGQTEPFAKIPGLPFKTILKINAVSDDDGNVCVYYVTNEKYHYALIDKKGTLLKINKYHEFEGCNFMGVISSDTSFLIFYNNYNERFGSIKQLVMSKIDGTIKENEIKIFAEKDEKLITSFAAKNELFILSVRKKSEKLMISKISAGSEILNHEIILPNNELYFSFLNSSLKFFEEPYDYSLYNAHYTDKIYLSETKITFIFEGDCIDEDLQSDCSEILELDRNTFNVEYKRIKPKIFYDAEKSNSILYHDYLFKIRLASKNLILSVYDFKSLNLIKEHSLTSKDSFLFADNEIYRGTLFDNKLIKNKNNTAEKPIRSLAGCYPLILAREVENSKIKLIIGDLIPESNNAPSNFNTFSPAFPMVGYSVLFSTNLLSNYSGSPTEKGIFFETTLALNSFEKTEKSPENINLLYDLSGLLNVTDFDKLKKDLFLRPDGLYVALMDINDKTIKIYRIK